MRKISLALILSTITIAIPLHSALAAEVPDPAVWITPGGGIAWPPAELGFGHNGVSDTDVTFGGIFGVRLAPSVALEVRGHYLTKEELGDLEILHGEGQITGFLLPGRRIVPLLTAGAGMVDIENNVEEDDGFAWNVGAGALIKFSDHIGLRLDVRRLSYELPDFQGEEAYRPHMEVFAGLNLGFGGTPKDTDRDGVANRSDACPNTPAGARVDPRGCPIDTDNDGVADGIDACEATPAGATIDARGCPTDADSDGVYDGLDECAETPLNALVDAKGCGLDSDADGVFDGLDKCDGTRASCTVNAEGCPTDADSDGICDGIDDCPDTPADARVDSQGCPIVVTEKETELLETGMIRLQNVNFDSGKATIKPESFKVLDEVGNILNRWPDLRVEVGGHTDSQGTDTFNQTLSDERAKAVREYLLGRFPDLNPEQMSSMGYGEGSPIAPNDSALNRAKNRRVEFKVLNTEALKRETERTRLAPKDGGK